MRRSPGIWFGPLLAAYLLAVAAAILILDGGVILAGHPAYTLTLALVALLSLGAIIWSLRRRRERGDGAIARGRWLGVSGRILGALLVLVLGGVLLWLRPFAATEPALGALHVGDGVTVEPSADLIAFLPQGGARAGLIFFPGARVDPRAYAADMRALAADGYATFIVKEPFNIAFLAAGRADRVIAAHPEIRAWAVGGHSLGGVVAAQIAADHPDRINGLLFYAAYPASDLSAALAGTAVTAISGSNDGLATPAKVDAAKPNLPATTRYVVIAGGTHAYFGDYGVQPGDGQPTIDREAARAQIVAASLDLLRLIGAGAALP